MRRRVRISLTELAHDCIPLLLGHITMHRGNSKVGSTHFLCQPVDLPLGIAEDDGLGNCKRVVEVTERVEFPLFLFNSDEELFDALEGKFITLDKDAHGVGHELCSHLEHIVWKRCAEKDNLRSWGQVTVDVVNLVFETFVEQLIRLVKDKHLDVPRTQVPAPDHVEDATGGARNNVYAVVKLSDILANGSATDACVALDIHVVSKGEDDRLDLSCQLASRGKHECLGFSEVCIDRLEDGNRESRGFTRPRLSLGNHIAALDNG